jgi:phosphoribosylanthranilate isomerase
VTYSKFNKVLQKEFEVSKRARELLFGHKYEPLTLFLQGQSKINPRVIRRLKEFDAFKKFVANQASSKTKEVDVLHLKSFIHEIDLRYNIIKSNLEKGEIILSGGITMQDIFYGALKELSLTNRDDLQGCLQEQNEEILSISSHVEKVSRDMEEIKQMIRDMGQNSPETPLPNKLKNPPIIKTTSLN